MSDNNTETTQELYRKKVVLGEKGKQAQSAVSLAVGGDDTFDEPEKGQPKQGSRNRRRDRRPRRGGERAARDNRERSAKKPDREPVERKPLPKPVNSRNSMEERLAYYREKYGENFKPVSGTE